jgi:UDP-N-acetylmuramate dehydrogenase
MTDNFQTTRRGARESETNFLLTLRRNAPLSPLSTFRIGGYAQYFLSVRSPESLIAIVTNARRSGLPFRILGGGSNVVFPDTLLPGLLLRVRGGGIRDDGNMVTVDAGVTLENVIEWAIMRGLKGLETLSGIPGTIGGAVVGNAGAYGHSIAEVVKKIEVWDGRRRRWIENAQCDFHYRESIFKKKPWIILQVVLRFGRGDTGELRRTSREIVKIRLKKYKPGLRCPGSFFKNVLVSEVPKRSLALVNPQKIIDGKIPTGYLLEEVGAKGMRIGGIQIASFHANLFINDERGTARDVRKLARILKARVRKQFGIQLEEEVRYF